MNLELKLKRFKKQYFKMVVINFLTLDDVTDIQTLQANFIHNICMKIARNILIYVILSVRLARRCGDE